jgi:hypothetical protein
MKLTKIISGGQTGADRAGLEAALHLELLHGGWCPRGRKAEDGSIPNKYELEETTSDKYPPRTAKNICESDATLILSPGGRPTRGTRLTAKIAHERKKPWLAINPHREDHLEKAAAWIIEIDPAILNIAGPRESRFPGFQELCTEFLIRAIRLAKSRFSL